MRRKWYYSIAVLPLIVLLTDVSWGQPTPGFNTKIPESVLTPDTVETRIGTLEFFDGIPNKKADSFSRNIVDMGPPGPHRGNGGKFLILPPGYDEADFEGLVPKGVYTFALWPIQTMMTTQAETKRKAIPRPPRLTRTPS